MTSYRQPPLLLFCYNRPFHLTQVIEKILLEDVDQIYIFSDGPRGNSDVRRVSQVREILIKNKTKNMQLFIAESNMGLRKSVTEGIARACLDHDRFVVLEDDCLPLPGFWPYMCQALAYYDGHPDISCVSAFSHPITKLTAQIDADTFFWPRFWSWGWGGWRRVWQSLYSTDVESCLSRLNHDGYKLEDFGADVPDAIAALRAGKLDSWAIPWFLNTVSRGMFTLYPVRTLVRNIGLDGSGRHCTPTRRFDPLPDIAGWPPDRFRFPSEIKVDPTVHQMLLNQMARRD